MQFLAGAINVLPFIQVIWRLHWLLWMLLYLLAGPKGNRRIPFADFHRLPGNTPEIDNNLVKGELIVGVEIPDSPFNKNVHYLKVRDQGILCICTGICSCSINMNGNTIKDARLAMGGVAHKPWRLVDAEKASSR